MLRVLSCDPSTDYTDGVSSVYSSCSYFSDVVPKVTSLVKYLSHIGGMESTIGGLCLSVVIFLMCLDSHILVR